MTDCSLCGLCVRYCAEVAKKNALYFQGRGINRRVAFIPGIADCDSCRECFGLCTGGWIVSEHGRASADLERLSRKRTLGTPQPSFGAVNLGFVRCLRHGASRLLRRACLSPDPLIEQ